MISGRMLVLHLGPVWLAFKHGRGLWGLRIGPWCFGRTVAAGRRRRRWNRWRAGAYVKARQARLDAGRRSFAALAALGLVASSCPICQGVELSQVDSGAGRRCLKCGYTGAADFFDREFWEAGAAPAEVP